MTKDELKRRLRGYRNIKAEIVQIKELMEEVDAKMEAPKGATMDGTPKGSCSGDPMVGIVSQRIELQKKYQTLQTSLIEQQSWIEDRIAELDTRERRLMRCYYLQGMTWEQVCVAMNYSWMQTHRLHNNALACMLSRCNDDNNDDDIE